MTPDETLDQYHKRRCEEVTALIANATNEEEQSKAIDALINHALELETTMQPLTIDQALDALVQQAQELDMGYGEK